jgi:hypothetical protein
VHHENNLVVIAHNDTRVTPTFAALGSMYEAAGLIWSGVAPQKMDHATAILYCQSLGEGARLPSKEEWEALSLVISPGGQYNPDLLPGTQGWFWSSSVASTVRAFRFVSNSGDVAHISLRKNHYYVRCVRSQ